jgi:solute carrier family 25 protein 43
MILFHPADTIKTRLQFQGKRSDVKKYNNFIHAFRVIWKEEGLLAFARGLPARLIYLLPAAGQFNLIKILIFDNLLFLNFV